MGLSLEALHKAVSGNPPLSYRIWLSQKSACVSRRRPFEGWSRSLILWRLNASDTSALLGDISERSWFRLKKREAQDALSQDQLMRISLLVGIFKGLRLIFSQPLADEWVRLPNQGALFGGQTPLECMIRGGIPA